MGDYKPSETCFLEKERTSKGC